jgi:two-component system NtrC family sensor kinase
LRHSKLDAANANRSQETPGRSAGPPLRGLGKLFGDLKVRPKLMILHNLFFLVLTAAVYLSLIPPFQRRMADAEARETALATAIFARGSPPRELRDTGIFEYKEGPAATLGVPDGVRRWLQAHPGEIWKDAARSDYIYGLDPQTREYRKARLPHALYEAPMSRARRTLLAALALIYAMAVLLLEAIILPLYVYRPLRAMLEADEATQCEDHAHELIDERFISNDEFGQIMRSRNATIAELRRHERSLASALVRLEEAAQDLQRKNHQLETAKRSLADQDRLASLGLMSAGVAHELNTPLAVLHGSIEKLRETVEDPAAQERLARMLRVSERLRKISASLLDFSRERTGDLHPLEIRRVIDEAWSLVEIEEKAHKVRFENKVISDQLVIGNTDRLVQVFVNLLRNALSAIQLSGEIIVRSRSYRSGAQDWISVTVEDDGPGIASDVLPHIFEAFVTSRLDSRGTGLGLSVAQGIIEQHGGTIEASNRPGGGACLEVRLPAAFRTGAASARERSAI